MAKVGMMEAERRARMRMSGSSKSDHPKRKRVVFRPTAPIEQLLSFFLFRLLRDTGW